MKRRVVVTGMAGLSPIGSDWKTVSEAIRGGRSGIEHVAELGQIEGMATRLGARVRDFEVPDDYPRKRIRSMGRVSLLATRATELALADAGLLGDPLLGSGRVGISYGSTSGSPPAIAVYADAIGNRQTLRGIRATDYVQFMSHTVAANLAQFFEVRGRIVTTCSACTSGSQGIGFGFEAIQQGKQDVMLTGGAEEFHPIDAAVFDVMYATSTRNDAPSTSPRPFDRARDGLVVGEGAGTLVLEALDHARARGARIHAELVGWGTNCDGRHITNPDREGMAAVMRIALEDAGLGSDRIAFVSAHGTATEAGDIAESLAMQDVFGERIPTSSLKSYMGHTLGACGALEAWMTLAMQREGWFAPTLNLDDPDPRCGRVDYVMGAPRRLDAEYVMKNNFAFGGVNTSLVFRRMDGGSGA
ncbi:MAG: beta-ketoacyl-ACP synthase [Deltaproteobacteria bacterium]|nr:beta-ketoacyl-ACP synthase [Deltaproteobacteria bacterium]